MALPVGFEIYSSRLSRLGRLLDDESLDVLIVFDLLNVRYLCGFTGSNGVLLASRKGFRFLTDSRYIIQACEETAGVEAVESRDLDQSIVDEVKAAGAVKVGLQAKSLNAARWKSFENLLPKAELIDLGTLIDQFRTVKDASEVRLLKDASKLAEYSLLSILPLVRPGMSEREIAAAFHIEVLKNGAEGLSFDTIVASGPRGALPHARPGDRKLQNGDLTVIDFGVRLNGYCSDQTVTLPVGRPDAESRRIYDVVLAAQAAALNKLKAGVKFSDVDDAARKVVTDAGFGEFFRHGTGHGVGLAVHEAPTVNSRSLEVAKAGHVVTIEPGIYLSDRLGVRIEDVVLTTDNGYDLLTVLPKELGAVADVANVRV